MKTLYMMRHGQTLFNQKRLMQGWCDSPLTELGKRQARCVKEYLENNEIVFDGAYASSSERACDTLEIVTSLPYQRLKGLKEWNFGIYEGESERVSTTVLELMKNTDQETVLIVSHGLSCYCFAKRWEQNQQVSLPNDMPNCVVLKYQFNDEQFSLVEVIDVTSELK